MHTLDTNVVIYYLHGESSVIEFVDSLVSEGSPIYILAVTVAELFSFSRMSSDEMFRLERLTSTFVVVPTEFHTAKEAGILRSMFGIDLADSIIATTALFTGSTLVTRNVRDFRAIPDLRLLKI